MDNLNRGKNVQFFVYEMTIELRTGDFRQYDYGPKKNVAVYGKKLPPAYNLTACTVANAFFYGKTDTLTMPEVN